MIRKIKNIVMFCFLLTQATTENYSSNPNFNLNIDVDSIDIINSINSTLRFEHEGRKFEICNKENIHQKLWFTINEIEQETIKENVGQFILYIESNNQGWLLFDYFLTNKKNNEITHQKLDKKIMEILFNIMMPEFTKIYKNEDFPEKNQKYICIFRQYYIHHYRYQFFRNFKNQSFFQS